ncbi:MAG: hypothetical protein FWF78_03145 [Defluviitaleaceae bacterium]|nr:hypothetical protein [Defluviitaleaceae bacterium]
MDENKYNGRPLTNDDDDYSFDNYNEDTYESYDYDSYDNYTDDDGYSLTRDDDDDVPLTSSRYDTAPLVRTGEKSLDRDDYSTRNRPPSRSETIKRVAEDQRSGNSRKPGVTQVDPRIAAITTRRGVGGDTVNLNGLRPSRSDGSRRRDSSVPHGAGRTRSSRSSANASGRPNAPRNAQKSKFAAFYIVLLMIAVGVCLTVLLIVMQNMDGAVNNLPVIGRAAPTPTPSPPPATTVERIDLRSQTSLITAINPFGDSRTLTLLDISTRRTQEFTVSDEVRLHDRLNRPLTFSELRVGNMIDIGYDARSFDIATINESRQAWERRSRPNVQVDLENFEISLGNEVWSFNAQTLVMHRGEPFAISQIRPIDSVTLVGYGDTVWLVQIDSAHGFLQINNADVIANGTLMIGTNLFFQLDDIANDIQLHEGTHRVTVEGDNIETFIENVEISAGQITRLNMGDAQLRAALLHIGVMPEDASVFVNGEQVTGSPVTVEFGEVVVRVEREGFLPQEQHLDVTAPATGINFELVEIVNENTVVIFTLPTNAEIFFNNIFIGHSTLTHVVPSGTFEIRARLPGYESPPYTLTITGNEPNDIMRTILLVPTTDDPLANITQPLVDPIPDATPLPTLPPDGQPDTGTQNNQSDIPWWLQPPGAGE